MKYLLLFCAVAFATHSFSQILYPYSKDGKYGFCDDKKNVVVVPEYSFAKPYQHGLAFVKKDGLWGALNSKGKLVIPIKYQDIRFGYNAYVIADSIRYDMINGTLKAARLALFDSTGKRIYKARFNKLPTPFGWDDEDPYPKTGSFTFAENGKFGTMDHKYKITAAATKTDEYGPKYSQGLIAVAVGEKYGYKDKKGVMVIPAKYDEARDFDEYGNAEVKLNGKTGLINTKGNVVIEPKYNSISESSGFYTVETGSKIGLYNRMGKEIIPCCTLGYPVFSFYADENYLVYRQDETTKKYGFMDTTGTFVIAPQFDKAYSFKNNKAWVKNGDKEFFINLKGERVTPEYDEVEMNCMNNDTVILFARGDGWGVADYNGKELFYIPGYILRAYCSTYSFFSAEKEGMYGVVNLKGEWVVKPEYKNQIQFENGMLYYFGPEKGADGGKWVGFYILPNGTELRD